MRGYAGVVENASNIRVGGCGCPVTEDYFLAMYPQFGDPAVIPNEFLKMTLDRANETIQEARWHKNRPFAVCLFVAHYCTLYAKTAVPAGAALDPSALAGKGENKGAMTSKSVDGVSISYAGSEGSSDLIGYGSLKDTVFGQQLASMARMVGAGMMVIR